MTTTMTDGRTEERDGLMVGDSDDDAARHGGAQYNVSGRKTNEPQLKHSRHGGCTELADSRSAHSLRLPRCDFHIHDV